MMIEVVEEINQSELPASTKANALALLSLAHHDNGHCTISWQNLARVFGHISVARSRRHLGMMQAIGLIHYSSNGDELIYINFKAWSRVDARKTTTEWSKNDQSMVEKRASTRDPEQEGPNSDLTAIMGARNTTTEWTENARGRAKNDHDLYASAPAEVSQLVSTDPLPDTELTNKLAPPGPTPKRQVWEAPLSFRLLTDKRVAMSPKVAERLAANHPYHHIRDAVAHWWEGRKSVGGQFDERPGLVIFWLDNPEEFTIPVMSDTARSSDLFRCYQTPDELAAEQAAVDEAQRLADEEQQALPAAAAPTKAEPEPGTPEAYWQQVRKELEIEQAGTFDRWLDGTYVLAYIQETNAFGIVLPDATRADWIRHRLAKQIVRKLSVITRKPALVDFIVPTPETGEAQGDNA